VWLPFDAPLTQHDQRNLQAISDRCTKRIQELDQLIPMMPYE